MEKNDIDRKAFILRIFNIVIFLLCLSAGAVSIMLSAGKKNDYSALEKRKLKNFPAFTLKAVRNGSFQDDIEDAFSDHFIERDDLVTFKTDIEILSGKSRIGDTYIMKDGTLVEVQDTTDADKKQLDENVSCLSWFMNKASSAFGKDHVRLMLVPGKEEVYLNDLPEKGLKDMDSAVYKKLSEKIKDYDDVVIELLPDMRKNRKKYIYYRTDHHWTSYGALLAYMSLGASGFGNVSKKDSSGEMKFSTIAYDFLGTDYNRIHYKKQADRIMIPELSSADNSVAVINDSGEKKKTDSIYDDDALSTEDKYNYFLSGNYSSVTVKTPVKNGKTLVVIKDSFANSLVPFLTQDYQKIVLIDPRYVNSSVLDYMSDDVTDILIVYNTSKFMRDTHQTYLK